MSIYPRFTSNSNSYNSKDVISQDDFKNSGTITLDLSSFVSKSAAVFDDDVYMSNSAKLNFNGVKQSAAYSDEDKEINLNNKIKTTRMVYDENVDKTTMTGNLDLLQSVVEFADESIPILKVENLTSTLVGIQSNLANISSNDADILNLQTLTDGHTDRLDTNESLNDVQTGRLDAVELDVSDNVHPVLLEHTADILAIQQLNTFQSADILSNSSDITVTASDLALLQIYAGDLSANLDTFKTQTDADFLDVSTNLSQHTNDIGLHGDRLDVNEALNVVQNNRLTAAELVSTTQQTEIDAAELVSTNQQTELDSLDTLTQSHTTDLAAHATDLGAHTTNLSTNNALLISHSNSIAANVININAKQPLITLLNANKVGAGDVSNAQLSSLNTVRTDVPIQSQIDTINSNLTALDALQDIDLVNIPAMQTNISALQTAATTLDTDLSALEVTVGTQGTSISSLLSSDTAHDSEIASLVTSTATNTAGVLSLVNKDGLIDGEITALQSADNVLQGNINLKNDLITLSNMLGTDKIFDVSLNDSLNNILNIIDGNITALSSEKQDALSGVNKLNSLYLDLSTTSLQYVDITAPLKAQLTSITSAINTLQNLTSNDTITTFQDIEDNFDSLAQTKLDKSVYDDTVAPQITNILASISTLQGLQDGDIISFNSINSSITNLQNTKNPLIDVNNKLNSSLLNRDDSLQYVDINSSLSTSLSGLSSSVALKNDVISGANKLNSSLLNRDDNLQYCDVNSSLSTSLTNISSSLAALSSYDVAQTSLNSGYTSSLASLVAYDTAQTSINTAQTATNNTLQTNIDNIDLSSKHDVIDVNNKLTIANIDLGGSDLINMDYSTGSLTTKLNSLQTNINNIVIPSSSKIEDISLGSFISNTLTYTFNEENIIIDQLTSNNVFNLDLTIDTPTNYKTYVQKILIDALEFKGYVNTLTINNEVVEIKYEDGDLNINLAPISGYSLISQEFQLTKYNDTWWCTSKVQLYYNSLSNKVYDITDPIITMAQVNGSAVINHEINTTYTDPGATANDNIDGNITVDIVVSGAVDTATLGTYNIYYDISDNAGNTDQKIRVVNVVDTTNPVVTLTGSSEITLDLNGTYTELGAIASDNSNESLTVVISGSVDTTIEGDYTITYTATDSTGNIHAIGRLIHVVGVTYTLQYSNSSTNIFDYVGFYNLISGLSHETILNFTKSGGAVYINGNYTVEISSFRDDKFIDSVFNDSLVYPAGGFFETANNSSYVYTDSVLGTMNKTSLAYDSTGYIGNSSTAGAQNHQQFCSNGITYGGEFLEITFPFYLEISKFYLEGNMGGNAVYFPHEVVILGSNDKINYNFIAQYNQTPNTVSTINEFIVTSSKYKHFKIIATKVEWGRSSLLFEHIHFYGDIYTAN